MGTGARLESRPGKAERAFSNSSTASQSAKARRTDMIVKEPSHKDIQTEMNQPQSQWRQHGRAGTDHNAAKAHPGEGGSRTRQATPPGPVKPHKGQKGDAHLSNSPTKPPTKIEGNHQSRNVKEKAPAEKVQARARGYRLV